MIRVDPERMCEDCPLIGEGQFQCHRKQVNIDRCVKNLPWRERWRYRKAPLINPKKAGWINLASRIYRRAKRGRSRCPLWDKRARLERRMR